MLGAGRWLAGLYLAKDGPAEVTSLLSAEGCRVSQGTGIPAGTALSCPGAQGRGARLGQSVGRGVVSDGIEWACGGIEWTGSLVAEPRGLPWGVREGCCFS